MSNELHIPVLRLKSRTVQTGTTDRPTSNELNIYNTLVAVLEYRVAASDIDERAYTFRLIKEQKLERALGEYGRGQIDQIIWRNFQALKWPISPLVRQSVAKWADSKQHELSLIAENRRMAAEVTLHTEWLKVRESNRQPFDDSVQSKERPAASEYIEALRAYSTPLGKLRRVTDRIPVDWTDDTRSPHKAYIMAVWSEAAYLSLPGQEIPQASKFKVYEPSMANPELRHRRLSFPLQEIASRLVEAEVRVFEIPGYLFVAIEMWNVVIVAVRGTRPTSVPDWLMNFEAWQKANGSIKYHLGFLKAALEGKKLLRAHINRGVSVRPIYFTGHSQGAAVAAILSKIWPPGDVKIPYLFACPRWGAGELVHDHPRYTYVRPYDVIPHVPPAIMGLTHRGCKPLCLPDDQQQRTFLQSLAHWIVNRTAEPHYMEGYRRLLGNQIGERYAASTYLDALFTHLKYTT